LPNDDTEQAREHLKHRVYSDYLLNGEYFKAPIGDNPQKIVDLGTGAGFWPIDGSYPPFPLTPSLRNLERRSAALRLHCFGVDFM
jgi:hypothetical protein